MVLPCSRSIESGVITMAVPGGFCPVGQVWSGYDPEWIEPGAIHGGGETFFMLVDPNEGCACPVGFEVSTLDFFMTFPDDTPIPVTITVSMALAEADFQPDGPLPWLPGDTVCQTPARDFTFQIPKQFVGFGMGLECECAAMDEPYFLAFTVHSVMDPLGGLFTDGSGEPATGRYLTLVDDQWIDLVAAGTLTRGDLVLSGFARCCEVPVAVDDRTWSSIRSLYR